MRLEFEANRDRSPYQRMRRQLPSGTLLLVGSLLVLLAPLGCRAEGRAPLPRDSIIEDAILQTFAPPELKVKGRQSQQEKEQKDRRQQHDAVQDAAAQDVTEPTRGGQQEQQQYQVQVPDETRQRQQQQQLKQMPDKRLQLQRQQQQVVEEEFVQRQQETQDSLLKKEAERAALATKRDRTTHEAAHADLLETQRRHVVQQEERLAARQEEKRQQLSLGRGLLRSQRQSAQKQPAVSGSRPGDMFAEQTEKRLMAARERQAARREEQAVLLEKLEAAHAAAQAAANTRAAASSVAGAGRQPQLKQLQQQQQAGTAARSQGAAGFGSGTHSHHIPLPLIIIMTFVMAAAAGLGALPFFFVRSMSESATGAATAVACGVMLAASFDLVHDGQPYGPALTVVGVLLGSAFIRWVQQQLAAYEDIRFGDLQGTSARKTVLMVGIMAAHALGEGCAVGVSFCGERGWAQGVLTTLAIGVHNIPEGLAKATVLVGQGVSTRRALGWSIVTCLPQPLVAVPSFMFVEAFMMILPVALGFAAGCMIWMVFAELLPDALERTPVAQVATAATVSAAGLEGFRMLFASMEQADGSIGGAGAATAAHVAAHMAGPLLVLLPAVAATAVGGGTLGGSAVPGPVAWGMAAAVSLSSGGGSILDQLIWRPQVPTLHTAAAAAAGAALALLLHKQLLTWAGTSAAAVACKLLAKGGGGAVHANGSAVGLGSNDVEALEYATLYQQHHLHHHVHAAHALFFQNGEAVPPHAGDPAAAAALPYSHSLMDPAAGSMNGFGSSTSSLLYQAPHHRSSTLPGAESGTFSSGATTPNGGTSTGMALRGLRHAGLLPPTQLAAAAATVAALAAASLTAGWHLACSLMLLGEDRSAAILPAAAMLLAGPGLGAGALARTLRSRHGAALGAWLGGGLAAVAAVAAVLTAAQVHETAHTASSVKSLLYPLGITDTAEAMAGGALCATATLCFGAGAAMKAPSARGGLFLGLVVTGLLAGLRYMLCSFTPYCLSVQLLLKDW